MKSHYTQDEANEILRRAIGRLPLRDEMSREQLESIATEVGVTPDALARAEEDWLAERSEQSDRLAFAASRRLAFYKHLTAYVLFVVFIAVVTGADHDPDNIVATLTIALLWGIGIICHALTAFPTNNAHFETALTEWRIKRRAHELAAREIGLIPPKQDS